MNNKKICFIMCTNNDLYESEAVYYLNQLDIPEGFEVDLFSIKEAKSMCAGYNEGMQASDAKFKVYLHQDVFILNRNFLFDILELFIDEEIGMIGMVGSPQLPDHGIQWFGGRVGGVYYHDIYLAQDGKLDIEIKGSYCEVEAIDGLLMATQYDIPWREDIFCDWDFYDVSQSQEFKKRGWKIIVPKMEKPWCMHDEGLLDLKNYYKNRRLFIEEYKNGKNMQNK